MCLSIWHTLCLVILMLNFIILNRRTQMQTEKSKTLHPMQKFLIALFSARAGVYIAQHSKK